MPPCTIQFTLLQSYKALIAKVASKRYIEEPGSMVHQARIQMRMRSSQAEIQSQVDPMRAFRRIKHAFQKATHLGKKKAEEKLRRSLPRELLRRKTSHPDEFAGLFGTYGVLRVCA